MPGKSATDELAAKEQQVPFTQLGPSGVSVPTEERTVIITGFLADGTAIPNEARVTIPKGMKDLAPAAQMIWQQVGGLGKKLNDTTFEFYPAHVFVRFLAEFKIVSGITLG